MVPNTEYWLHKRYETKMKHKASLITKISRVLLLLAVLVIPGKTDQKVVFAQEVLSLVPPSLISPIDATSFTTRKPILDWSDVNGASSYRIQMSKTVTFENLLVNTTVIPSTYQPIVELPAKTIYWRVRAKDSAGHGEWSEIRSFTITPRTFYVSKNGNDSNTGGINSPFATITKAISVVAKGDTIYVLEGVYNEKIELTKSAITIEAQGKVTTKGVYVYGNNNTLRGFTITDPNSSAGIEVHGDKNLFEGNEIFNTKQDGIWFFGSYNTFRRNYIHDILSLTNTSNTHVDCFQTWGWDKNTTNVLFEGNICVNNRTIGQNAIIMVERESAVEVRDITFRNNVFIIRNPVYCSINFWGTTSYPKISNIYFLNNTVVNYSLDGENAIQFVNITNAKAINNLFVGFGNKNTYIRYVLVQGGSNVEIRNNAVYNPNGIGPAGTPYAGDIWMKNPKLASLWGNFDFHLLENSPLIDTGYNLGVVVNDLENTLRPSGAGYDIGAYEYIKQ